MKINPKDTIEDVLLLNNALFSLGAKSIAEKIKILPAVEYVSLKRKWLPDKKLAARHVSDISLGELDAINNRNSTVQYFIDTLGVMLGFVRFKKHLPDGEPDWLSGWEVDEKAIGRLRFIRAFRYFIEIQEDLDKVAGTWQKLGAWKRGKKNSKRPNRGLISICRQYCQMMSGAIELPDAWNIPWSVVFEAFESCDMDNKEQYEAYEEVKRKSKLHK